MLSKGLVVKGGWIHIRKTINGIRIQKSTGIPARRELHGTANRMLRDLEGEIHDSRGLRQPKTCAEGAARYLGSCQKKSPATIVRAVNGLDNILNFRLKRGKLIKDVYLHEVDFTMMEEFVDGQDGRWAKGIREDMQPFKRMLRHAARRWRDDNGRPWIDFVPEFPSPEGPSKRKHILSREEERALVSALPDTLQPMALFGIHTGCRAGEICGLKWSHYREAGQVAYFSLPADLTKTKRERPIVLNKSARGIVGNQERGEYVFANRSMHTAAWRRAWKAAGLPMDKDVMKGPHNLRHTFAFRLRDAGVTEWTVKDALGHKSGEVTRLYATPSLEAVLKAVEAPYLVRNWLDRERANANLLS